MKVKNIKTNIIFNLPKKEVESLIIDNPDIYELISSKTKKQELSKKSSKKQEKNNTILPLILDD